MPKSEDDESDEKASRKDSSPASPSKSDGKLRGELIECAFSRLVELISYRRFPTDATIAEAGDFELNEAELMEEHEQSMIVMDGCHKVWVLYLVESGQRLVFYHREHKWPLLWKYRNEEVVIIDFSVEVRERQTEPLSADLRLCGLYDWGITEDEMDCISSKASSPDWSRFTLRKNREDCYFGVYGVPIPRLPDRLPGSPSGGYPVIILSGFDRLVSWGKGPACGDDFIHTSFCTHSTYPSPNCFHRVDKLKTIRNTVVSFNFRAGWRGRIVDEISRIIATQPVKPSLYELLEEGMHEDD